MKEWKSFIFEDYRLETSSGVLTLVYSYDSELFFTETYTFPTEHLRPDILPALERAAFGLFMMAGVSYYKAYLPERIEIKKGTLNQAQADFFYAVYLNGLAQLLYENKLSPKRIAKFPVNSNQEVPELPGVDLNGLLVAFGGGKDSLLTMSVLDQQNIPLDIFSLRPTLALESIAKATGHLLWPVAREVDSKLKDLNASGAFNGHLPITGIVSFVGLMLALFLGKEELVFSNERSTREPSLIYEGLPVNHQYSKSFAFEQMLQNYTKEYICPDLKYYSLLRPLTDLRIAEVFSKKLFATYGHAFTSCNTNFKLDAINGRPYWCGQCVKCAATFLLFSPFLVKNELTSLFGGKDLLADESLSVTYQELLGLVGHKPLDCVGEIEENRRAFHMAAATGQYPETSRFNCPESIFDYSIFGEHAMPEERTRNVRNFLENK